MSCCFFLDLKYILRNKDGGPRRIVSCSHPSGALSSLRNIFFRSRGVNVGRHPLRSSLLDIRLLDAFGKIQCLGPTDSDWNDKSFRVTERGCVGGRKQPALLEGADFMQFSDATVSRRHFGIAFDREVSRPPVILKTCTYLPASPSMLLRGAEESRGEREQEDRCLKEVLCSVYS